MRRTLCLAAALLSLPAHAVLIDFDDPLLSDGDHVGDFYANLGVHFVDARIDDAAGTLNNYSRNVVIHSTTGYMPQPDDPVEILFEFEVSTVSLTGYSIGLAGFLLRGYDSLGNLLDSQEIAKGGQPGGGGINNYFTLTLSGIGMTRVAFSQMVVYSDGAVWDNLSFEPTNPQSESVPEPGTLLLVSSGLLVAGAMRRRVNRSGVDKLPGLASP